MLADIKAVGVGAAAALLAVASLPAVSAQTFQRLGTCPTLGCVLPPDQSEFLPGQLFDLRLEVHAPVNGSEAFNDGKPDANFTVTIAKKGDTPKSIAAFFGIATEPKLVTWQFSWYEDLFARDKNEPSVVEVASKVYRSLSLSEPGTYTVTLKYYGDKETTAEWTVRPIDGERKAKNVIFFIGDGMTTNMVRRSRHARPRARLVNDSDAADYGCPSARPQEHQRQIPDRLENGQVPRAGPPDDALH